MDPPEFFCFPVNQSLGYVVLWTSVPSFPQDEGAPESRGVSAWEWASQLN